MPDWWLQWAERIALVLAEWWLRSRRSGPGGDGASAPAPGRPPAPGPGTTNPSSPPPDARPSH